MINPGMMMKLMNAKNTFESNHPKFAAFVSRFFMGGAITEGTITVSYTHLTLPTIYSV